MPKFDEPFKYRQSVIVKDVLFSNGKKQDVKGLFLRVKKDANIYKYVILYDGMILIVDPDRVEEDKFNPFIK